MPETLNLFSFPLDCTGWFRSQIIQDPVYTGNLSNDPLSDMMQQIVGNLLNGGRHGIARVDGTDDYGPVP